MSRLPKIDCPFCGNRLQVEATVNVKWDLLDNTVNELKPLGAIIQDEGEYGTFEADASLECTMCAFGIDTNGNICAPVEAEDMEQYHDAIKYISSAIDNLEVL